MVDVFDPYALSVTEDEYESSIVSVKDGKRQWVDYEWKHDKQPLPAVLALSLPECQ